MNYAIPGFQTPESPKLEGRVDAKADGTIEFPFLEDLNLDFKVPKYDIWLTINRGEQLRKLAHMGNRYVYEKHDEHRNMKTLWFRLRADELTVLPGTYDVTIYLNGEVVATRSVTIKNTPMQPDNPRTLDINNTVEI